MPWSVLLECEECEKRGDPFQFRHLKMSRDEPDPACPVCEALTREGLAAPSINHGAAPQTFEKIPDNKTKAIDYAQRIIAEDSGVTNMKDRSRPGEAVAMPVPTQPGLAASWGGQLGPKVGGPGRPPISVDAALAMGRGDPHGADNLNKILWAGRQKGKNPFGPSPFTKPVYR